MKHKRIVATILLCALLLSGIQKPMTVAADTPKVENSSYAEEAVKSMDMVAETESLELYLDDKETVVAVRDKASGALWFSNPVDGAEDTLSTSYYQKVLKSQLYVTFIDENTKVSTMNNYTSSIENGQFEIEEIENGIKITYFIGDSALMICLPDVITEERMLVFLNQMTSAQQKKINRNYTLYSMETLKEDEKDEMLKKYPILAEQNIYVLRSGTKDYMKKDLASYFAEVGYTQADFELDAANNSTDDEEKKAWFRIPLVYQLEGDNLVVTVNPEEVEYNTNGFYLVNIDILRYFGASLNEDGYIFVPDGSGALINFNNGKTTEASYGATVYGQDSTMVYTTWYQSQVEAQNTIKMPVFGIKDGNKAVFAVIEEGDAYATIKADVAGKYTGYNDAYVSFNYLQYGSTSLSDMIGAASYYLYSDAVFEGVYKLRYAFLTGEQADYSGMAACYRDYLKENGVLGEQIKEQNLPFYVEYIGAIDKPDTFLGIKYDSVESVTTFAQAGEITDLLKQKGVENLNIIYSGWMNGGLRGTAATKLKVESKLKAGGTTLSEFQEYVKSIGADLYMTTELQYVYEDDFFDGYSSIRYAPRYFDNTVIKINQYGLASRVSEDELANLISPYYVKQITKDLTGKLKKQNVTGVNLGTISWELYSDLQKSVYTDRQMAKKENNAAILTLKDNGQKLIGDNANAYVFNYVDELIGVPLYSNNYRIIDEEVPFYEMVIHGYIPCAGEAMNLTDDYQTTLLKSVEAGTGLYFKWIYEDNAVLKETEYDYLYSVNYEAWLERATADYNRMNQELGSLVGCEMKSHEYVQEDVAKVTYQNGSRVYVNFSKKNVTVDGVTVPAKDYVVEVVD